MSRPKQNKDASKLGESNSYCSSTFSMLEEKTHDLLGEEKHDALMGCKTVARYGSNLDKQHLAHGPLDSKLQKVH